MQNPQQYCVQPQNRHQNLQQQASLQIIGNTLSSGSEDSQSSKGSEHVQPQEDIDPLARNLSDSEMSEDALDHAFDSDSEGERKKPVVSGAKKQLCQQPGAKVRAGADSNVFQVCLQIK